MINIKGQLYDLSNPIVMGILNVTPDSFYSGSRCQEHSLIVHRIEEIISQGATIMDIGGYSSRPSASYVDEVEEKRRLKMALDLYRSHFDGQIAVSIDTFRSDIVTWAYDTYGIAIVNDISAGGIDPLMFDVVSRLNIPYIMMHMVGTPQTMMNNIVYPKGILLSVIDYFIAKVGQLRDLGLHDIILDPGFGFSKTLEQNYELMANISVIKEVLQLPMLVGVSRKSMIYKMLDITPEESLNGTTVLNTMALLGGANILRVHDVAEAMEAVKIYNKTIQYIQKENSIHKKLYRE